MSFGNKLVLSVPSILMMSTKATCVQVSNCEVGDSLALHKIKVLSMVVAKALCSSALD